MPKPSVIEVWDDMHEERAGFFRAFWVQPGTTIGCPVVGYCSSGGSYRTIRAVVREVRKMGYRDPIFRNGRCIDRSPLNAARGAMLEAGNAS